MVSYIVIAAGIAVVMAVLILVVMEDGLVPKVSVGKNGTVNVLILVVMEDGLVPHGGTAQASNEEQSLNPCCNGRWSRTM